MTTPPLGKVGVWGLFDRFGDEKAAEVERLGYGAIWVGGVFESDLRNVQGALEHSESITVASGIVNIWTAPAQEVAASYHRLDARFPGRLVLGVGIGHPERSAAVYKTPYQALVAYLDELDSAGVPRDRLVLAALRSGVLKLSEARTAGAHPYLTPVAHTKFAREALGPGVLLAPEHKVVFETDPEAAHAVGREAVDFYTGLSNYVNMLREFGFPDLHVGDSASDELLDALVSYGTPERIAAGVTAHLEAGADHVSVQVLPTKGDPIPGLAALAEALGLRSAASG
ncbi:MAG: TIGR03620 family F420-dependent LLM class oxidoreductase [Segniliparus sp.]|uniref:TIGR03620 family F420-dependent LLM class oxidoreductase n=1 Tax=Segniliparus sp. TaxID=2804064 RepID=UPI003F3AF357